MIDFPYIIFYLILLFWAYLYWKTKNSHYTQWSLILAFVFFAFRAPVVGADTWNYVRYLTGERNFYNSDIRELEVAFVIYREIISKLTSSRFVVMVLNTILSMAPLYYIVKRYSLNVPLTILMFCYMNSLSVYFVGLRQVLAISCLLTAFIYTYEHKLKKYKQIIIGGLTVMFAYSLHTSSALYALIYITALFIPGGSKKNYIIIILLSALGGFLTDTFNISDMFSYYLYLDVSATERLNGYFEMELINEAPLYVIAQTSIIAAFVFYAMDEEKIKHPFCKIYIAGIVIYNLFYTVPMIHRIVPPLIMFGSILVTWCFDREYYIKLQKRKTINIILVLMLLYLTRANINDCINYDVYNSGRMHPYYFFFQDYNDHPSIKYFGS